MNIPSPPKSTPKAISKSWNPQSPLQLLMDNLQVAPELSRTHSDPLRRSALDPFLEGKECNQVPNMCVIPAQKNLQRRILLGDALGPNFGAPKTKDETESSSSYASLISKKRTNICSICGATDTPSWRRSKDNNRSLLCNACGLRNRSARKRHKGEEKSKAKEQSLPPSPMSSQLFFSPVDNIAMPLSPISPLIPSPRDFPDQNGLFCQNDPLSMLFWDDLAFENI